MQKTTQNKKGFTLIESMCVVAIIVILSSVLIMAVGDHIKNGKKAAAILENNNNVIYAIDQEVYGTAQYSRTISDFESYGITGSAGGTAIGGASAGGGGAPAAGVGGSGGSPAAGVGGSGSSSDGGDTIVPPGTGDNGGTDMISGTGAEDVSGAGGAAEEAPAVPEVSEEDAEEAAEAASIAAVASSINSFATAHDVSYLPGTEQLPNIIATAEVTAVNLYQEGDYNGPRYFTYCPATGETRLANGNGTYMQQDVGQNLLKAYLRDAAAEACEGSNVRGRLDSRFLTDTRSVIYIGVNREADGSYQVVPNLCIDTLGNFNTVITFRYNNSTSDRVTWNGNGGWNSYVNYVTNQSGEMLDTSVIDTSGYTRTSNASQDNPIWQAAINDLRNSY